MRYLQILLVFISFTFYSPHVIAQEDTTLYDKIIEQQRANEDTGNVEPEKTEQELYIEQLQSIDNETDVELPYSSYDDIPGEALDEMEEFHAMCETDFVYQMHYNCECLATRFLEERIRIGPNVPQTTVISTITGECIDRGKAAGTAFEQCQTAGGLAYMGGDIDPEEYCECVANNYAIILDQLVNTPLSRQVMQRSMSSAYTRCNEFPYGTINPLPRLDRKAREEQAQ